MFAANESYLEYLDGSSFLVRNEPPSIRAVLYDIGLDVISCVITTLCSHAFQGGKSLEVHLNPLVRVSLGGRPSTIRGTVVPCLQSSVVRAIVAVVHG